MTTINEVIKQISDDLKKTGNKQPMNLLGNYALNLIRDRTRKGFGVPGVGQSQEKLKALSANYIKYRKKTKLSPFTSPGKSNLTKTGSMLASLRVVQTKNFGFTIAPTGKNKSGISNAEVAGHVEENGRPFLYLSNTEIEKVIKFFEENILNKYLK